VGRSPSAARQLASRARRRVRAATVPDPDIGRQRQLVDAFLAASRAGDFEALLAVIGFTVANGKIVEIDILADPARLRGLDVLGGQSGGTVSRRSEGAGEVPT
jgi:hypothetical protein